MDRNPDPYRELGILRGATDTQVKAAHRRLAKRFHPDGPEGDHDRFLAIQEAYSLLSDPLRRRDWDAKHTSGPMRAGDPGRSRGGRPATARSSRATGSHGARHAAGSPGSAGSAGSAGAGPGAGSAAGSAGSGGAAGSGGGSAGSAAGSGGSRRSGGARSRATADARHAAGAAGDPEHPGGPWSASDRDPSTRSTTWSAAGVPWWEDFSPRDRGAGTAGAGSTGSTGSAGSPPRASGSAGGRPGAGGSPAGAAAGGAGSSHGSGAHRTTAQRSPEDVDVYSRSSGAAWSMAARRYFRKGEAELPKGGAWTYRGTQVVTGAEARKVAAELEAERRRAADAEAERRRAAEALLRSRAAADAAPRTAFGHEEGRAAGSRAGATPPSRASEARPASSWAAEETPSRQTSPAAPVDAAVVGEDGSFLRRVRKALGLRG